MRFYKDGPNIPDLLLDQRDKGRVVFLCGAGVSIKAGMPNFVDLTKYVVDFFDPPKGSAIADGFEPWKNASENFPPTVPLDQIFHLLNQEYGRDEVNALVAKRLNTKAPDQLDSKEHNIIARISSDQEGNPQIVTTNFDQLFERTLDSSSHKIYEPPNFPDIELEVPITGVTYLHGRLQNADADYHPYVLSSADFGRAYLSEAWATRFIRSLLNSYTVVLVGYKAEDPPVKYLLQGLNHDNTSDRSNLYAFDKGEPESIEAKWRDRGVTPIAYSDHESLWRSLNAWADRADNPRQWRSNIVNLALKSPTKLSAHERGQVVHLVRTTPGARLFSKVTPSPPPDWICVFDANCRAGKVRKSYGKEENFDPLAEYGLDDDPPRPVEDNFQIPRIHDHILEWRRGDTNPPDAHRFGGIPASGYQPMPPRLLHLSNWIIRHLNSPVTLWWVIRQNGLHSNLINEIRRELRRDTSLHVEARRNWNLTLESQKDKRNHAWDDSWFELNDRIEQEGWSTSIIRNFESSFAPILSRSLPSGISRSKPPEGSWDNVSPAEMVVWKVKFPDRHGKLEIPDEVLVPIFRVAEGHLLLAAGMQNDINNSYFKTPTCYQDREVDGQREERSEKYFSWFLNLFNRLTDSYPDIARSHVITWDFEEQYYFRKLKLFALNKSVIFSANEVAKILLDLEKNIFWDFEIRRELLFLIEDRWESFTKEQKNNLFDRLIDGPSKSDHWLEEDYPRIKIEISCRYLKYLVSKKKTLNSEQIKLLESNISKLPEWHDGWANSLVSEDKGLGGWARTDEAPDLIIDLPVSQIVEKALEETSRDFRSLTEKRPFIGLVKENPRKALSSLSYAAKNGEFPAELWKNLINEWPEYKKYRQLTVFLNRLTQLPHETIIEIRHSIGSWIENKFVAAFTFNQDLAWKVFDHFLVALSSIGIEPTKSAVGDVLFVEEIKNSRRTYEHAINGPIGELMQGLLAALNSLKLAENSGIPSEFKGHIEQLLSAPGEGKDHAVSILGRDINWLNYLDSDFVKNLMLPWFEFENSNSEPAWNGYLSGARLPSPTLIEYFKPLLIELFSYIYLWHWDDHPSEIATQIIIELAVVRSDEINSFSASETRQCLRAMNDHNRRNAVFRLKDVGMKQQDGWLNSVVPFINEVWPRERKYRTSTLVSAWVTLLENTGEYFPAVLKATRKFLVPVKAQDYWLYRFTRNTEKDKNLTVQYPESTLELLDATTPNDSQQLPPELGEILGLIEEIEPDLTKDRRFLHLINLIEHT